MTIETSHGSETTAMCEVQRLRALRAYSILDTLPEEGFDRIIRFAARMFNVPMALVSFVDADRQWFKAKIGIDISETPRAVSFCSVAVANGALCEVGDARADPRFSANPLVVGDPTIRFYAGMPLMTPDGYALGTICVLDREPRGPLSEDERETLRQLADAVMNELKLHGDIARHEMERRSVALRENLLAIVAEAPDFSEAVNAAMGCLIDATDGLGCFFWRIPVNGSLIELFAARLRSPLDETDYVKRMVGLRLTRENSAIADAMLRDEQQIIYAPSDEQMRRWPSMRLSAEYGIRAHVLTPISLGKGHYGFVIIFPSDSEDLVGKAALLSAMVSTMRPLLRRFRDGEEAELFRRAVEASGDAVIISELEPGTPLRRYIRYVNDSALRQTGYSSKELVGQPPPNFLGKTSDPAVANRIRDALLRGEPIHTEMLARRRDGSVYWTDVDVAPVFDKAGFPRHWISVVRDITERKRSQELVTWQAAMLERAQDAILVRSLDRRILYWNQGAERLYGRQAAEVLGRSDIGILYDSNDQDAQIHAVMTTGRWEGRLKPRRRDGTVLTVQASWTLIPASEAREACILSIATDMTERVQLEAQLNQLLRLEALGQLTGGIAHDFNNLLTVVLGNAELLEDLLEEQPDLRELAKVSRCAAERGAELTGRLLAFARKQPLDPRPTDINRLIGDMEVLVKRTLAENIMIGFVPGANLWTARVDPSQLENALLNLCINARDAMQPGGGKLTIETANTRLDEQNTTTHSDMVPGDYIVISVTDTGTGMAPEVLSRVFEPFFTTKEPGQGTGLGMSMVYGFVRQSEGDVSICSEVGEGTTIRIHLPRDLTDRRDNTPVGAASGEGGTEKILLVEDDDMVRHFAFAQLRKLGYQVLTASNGTEAMEVLAANEDIDLLFTDIVMPGGFSGKQLADLALAKRPGLAVLYTSGYPENAIVHQGRLDPGVLLLSKPYRRGDLAAKLREALARGSPI